jgi:hypothetical protein
MLQILRLKTGPMLSKKNREPIPSAALRAPLGIGTRYVGFHRTSHLPYDAHSLNRLIWWSDGLYATGGRFLLNCFH